MFTAPWLASCTIIYRTRSRHMITSCGMFAKFSHHNSGHPGTHDSLPYDSGVFFIDRWSLFLFSLNLSWPWDTLRSIKCSESHVLVLRSLGLKRPCCFCACPLEAIMGGSLSSLLRKPHKGEPRHSSQQAQAAGRHVNEAVRGQPACPSTH